MMALLRNKKGFSLLELLIAISLLAIGLLATANMQSVAINANSIANTLTVATSIGENVLEKLMSLRSNDPILNTNVGPPGTVFDLDPATAETSLTVMGAGTYTASYTIQTNTPIANITTIMVTVTVGGRNVQFTGYKRV